MEEDNKSKIEGILVMSTVVLNPPKARRVEAAPETGKESPPRNAGTVARKATRKASAGKSVPIRIYPDRAKPNTGIDSGRTTPKALKEPEMDRAPA